MLEPNVDEAELAARRIRQLGLPFEQIAILCRTNARLVDFEAALHESLMCAVEDLRMRMGPIIRIKDEVEKKRARREAAAGYLQEWGAAVERQIGAGPYLAGAKLCVADLKLFVAVGAYLKGTIDYIPTDVFAAFPKLLRLVDAVREHPRVVDWYARK